MTKKRRIFGGTLVAGVAVAGVAASGALIATSLSHERSGISLPSYNDGDNLGQFIQKAYADHDVRQCVGRTGLLTYGNVRLGPDDTYIDNIVTAFADNKGNVILVDPKLVKVDPSENPGIPNSWFMFGLPNGQDVFVNQEALVNPNAFQCGQLATPQSYIGTISMETVTLKTSS